MAFTLYKHTAGTTDLSHEDSPAYAGRHFILRSYGGVNHRSTYTETYTISGIANESPVVKYSTSWEAGPTTVFAKKYEEFMNHDIIKTFASANGKYKPIVATDSWTQMYPNAGSNIETSFTFRAYPYSMYDTNNYFNIIGILTKLTTPSKFLFSDGIDIIDQALEQAMKLGYDIGKVLKQINDATEKLAMTNITWSDVAKTVKNVADGIKNGSIDNIDSVINETAGKEIFENNEELKHLVEGINVLIYIMSTLTSADGVGIEHYSLEYGKLFNPSYNNWVITSWSYKPSINTTVITHNGREIICPIYIDFDISLKTAEKLGTSQIVNVINSL